MPVPIGLVCYRCRARVVAPDAVVSVPVPILLLLLMLLVADEFVYGRSKQPGYVCVVPLPFCRNSVQIEHKIVERRICDRTVKLNGLIKRNDHYLNASGVLA